MAVERKRMQQRYGTYEQFQKYKSNLLPNEFASVISGDPNTKSRESIYFNFDKNKTKRVIVEDDNILSTSINAEMFGAVGDGITDDTDALQKMFDYAASNNLKIELNSNTYLISSTINYNTALCKFEGNMATFKANNKRYVPYLIQIKVTGGQTNAGFFQNLIVDCNCSVDSTQIIDDREINTIDIIGAENGILVEWEGKTHFDNVLIRNPFRFGIRITGGQEATFSRIHGIRSNFIEIPANTVVKTFDTIPVAARVRYLSDTGEIHEVTIEELEKYYNKQLDDTITDKIKASISSYVLDRRNKSTLIYAGTSDTLFDDCIAVDFENGFLNGANDMHYTKCHVWCNAEFKNRKSAIIEDTASFVVWGGAPTFVQCCVDSTRYGWYFANQGRALISACVSAYNIRYQNLINTTKKPPYVLYFDKYGKNFKSTLLGEGVRLSSCSFKNTDENIKTKINFDNLFDTQAVESDFKPDGDFNSVHCISPFENYSNDNSILRAILNLKKYGFEYSHTTGKLIQYNGASDNTCEYTIDQYGTACTLDLTFNFNSSVILQPTETIIFKNFPLIVNSDSFLYRGVSLKEGILKLTVKDKEIVITNISKSETSIIGEYTLKNQPFNSPIIKG